MDLLLVAAVFLGALIVCLLCGFDLFWALALTFAALFLCARRRGTPVKELRNLIRREMPGADFSAVPYACYLYLIPLCYLFTKRFFFPAKTKANEVTKP